jgi:hypothetical protein
MIKLNIKPKVKPRCFLPFYIYIYILENHVLTRFFFIVELKNLLGKKNIIFS